VPTYTYTCKSCHHRFDQHQDFAEAALTVCPECAGQLRKVFSSVGVVFKGSGFYHNDSRAKAGSSATKPAAKPTEAAAKAGEPGKAGGSSESSKPSAGQTEGASESGKKSVGKTETKGSSDKQPIRVKSGTVKPKVPAAA